MRKKPLLILAALAGAAIATPSLAGPITPEKILEAQGDLTYSGLLLINGTQRVQVVHGSSHQQRQTFLGHDGEVADLMVSDGHIRWHYAPRTHVVRLMPMEEEAALPRRLALLANNYHFKVMGQARKADRTVVVARFTPINPGNLTHILWVDPSTYLPLAVERRRQDGSLVDRSEYLQIAYHPALPKQTFRFQIPDGCRVLPSLTMLAHGAASTPPPSDLAFKPTGPRNLPQGYKMLAWKCFTSANNIPTFNWRYHDGLNSLSLFATAERSQPHPPANAKEVAIAGNRGYMATQGANRMLMWRVNSVAYTLIGQLPQADLVKVAESTF